MQNLLRHRLRENSTFEHPHFSGGLPHDAVAFMGKMVTDSEISKVAIVCDEVYAAKSDGRAGGVGAETQIISREVCENQEQDKFVAVVSEKDEQGEAYLPAYYKSRIYIDLSEPDNYTENFEKLLRWVYGKPLYRRPEIGKRPSFLYEQLAAKAQQGNERDKRVIATLARIAIPCG